VNVLKGDGDANDIGVLGLLFKEVLQQVSPGQAKSLVEAYRDGRSITASMAEHHLGSGYKTAFECSVSDARLTGQFFHVTAPDAVDSILAHGLRANEYGHIFTITDEGVADIVAGGQLFLATFALFEIDPKGITGATEPDNVGELICRRHRIIVQELIAPEFLTLVTRERETSKARIDAFYRAAYKAMGFKHGIVTAKPPSENGEPGVAA
jgi:hypothetical protein